MKDALIEIMNNLLGSNSRMNKSKNQINDLEHKEEKKFNQKSKKKKEYKKQGWTKEPLGQLPEFEHSRHRGARRRRERARNCKYI